MTALPRVVGLALLLQIWTVGQGQLRVKGSGQVAVEGGQEDRVMRSRSLNRIHLVIEFEGMPTGDQIAELRRRHVEFLRYVPDYGFMVSADYRTSFDGLELRGISQWAADSKLSPGLGESETGYVVEFHPDVSPQDARALLQENGLEIQDYPNLLQGHWLVTGTRKAVSQLATWDEVAYIFRASDDLHRGKRVISCGGGIAGELGPVGQYVASIGDGWDGPGKNSAQLTYYFGGLTTKVPQDIVRTQILNALTEWTKYVQVSFAPASSPYANRCVAILFGSRNHGDSYPFDGPGGILAHTFYPFPVNSEPLAGDMHFDADENWTVGSDPDIFSVALHELGHALGLGHSDQPGAVMYPYYRRATGLSPDDIDAIRQLYASTGPGAPSGGTPTPTPAPTPIPAPPPGGPPDTTAPSLTIVYPASTTVTTTASSIAFRGTASDNVGVAAVTWTATGGRSGTATGTTNWGTPDIPLYQGANTITIRASDAAGNVGWRAVVVTRR